MLIRTGEKSLDKRWSSTESALLRCRRVSLHEDSMGRRAVTPLTSVKRVFTTFYWALSDWLALDDEHRLEELFFGPINSVENLAGDPVGNPVGNPVSVDG